MSNKPIIGITLDWEDSPTYAKYPWYALRTNYSESVSQNNAVPILIPYDLQAINQYISMIDGIIIPGGDYDLAPSVYGEEISPKTRNTRSIRTNFETSIIKAALAKNIPVLAICAGQQLLAAIHGGKLLQDIKTSYPNALEHEQSKLGINMHKPSHFITITPGTLLHKITKKNKIKVNSSHHQAVKSVGPNMVISARAEDNVIEAIEMPEYSFALGLEWHPEFQATKEDSSIIQAFIAAAKND